jgi:hypothetical protein
MGDMKAKFTKIVGSPTALVAPSNLKLGIRRTFSFTVALSVIGLAGVAQPIRPPEPPAPPTPQQAYKQMLSVPRFAFGGVGYAGVTSPGEVAYHAIAGSTNALALFSTVFSNGNAQAKLYALCGIRQFARGRFNSYADSLRSANPKVETMQGCLVLDEFATNIICRISTGSYDFYLTTGRSQTPQLGVSMDSPRGKVK